MKVNIFTNKNKNILELKTDKININLHIKDMDIDNKELVDEFLKLNLKPKLIEKRENGEVFTPSELINEMLDKLPEEVWSNKDLKWFDPSVGMGNFMVEVYWRLLEGLVDEIPDFNQRKQHIIKNMIYMSELNEENIKHCNRIFSDEINIYQGDTLKMPDDYFGVGKFDVIVGNPPYQAVNENGRKALNCNLWSKFVSYSFDILKDEGYLNFITPPSWMSVSPKYKIFYENNIIYLNIHECEKWFNVGSKFSYYVIKKTKEKTKTVVKCKYKNKIYESVVFIDNSQKFLPVLLNDVTMSILNKFYNNDLEKVSFKRNFVFHTTSGKKYLSDIKNEIFKYPVKHTTKIRYSNIKHSLADNSKILINASGYLKPFYDKGEFGFTENQMYLLIDNDKFISVLNSELYKFIFSICKWSGFNTEKIFHNIPYIDDELSVYEKLKISEEEIKFIQQLN